MSNVEVQMRVRTGKIFAVFVGLGVDPPVA